MNTTPLDRMTAAAALLREVEADNARLQDLLTQWAAMDHKRAELQAYYTSVWVDDRDQVATEDSDVRYAMGEDPIFDAISVRDEVVRHLIKELRRNYLLLAPLPLATRPQFFPTPQTIEWHLSHLTMKRVVRACNVLLHTAIADTTLVISLAEEPSLSKEACSYFLCLSKNTNAYNRSA